jgi:hypothetical protein
MFNENANIFYAQNQNRESNVIRSAIFIIFTDLLFEHRSNAQPTKKVSQMRR